MADQNRSSDDAPRTDEGGKTRFRLPRMFAETEEVIEETTVTPDSGGARHSLAQAAAVLQMPERELAREAKSSSPKAQWAKSQKTSADTEFGDAGAVMRELEALRRQVDDIGATLQEFSDRGIAQDKVFSTLHSELQDYKNDFIYEHLKPVVRPLLFLFDSLEQFDNEMAQQEVSLEREKRGGLTPTVVRENVVFFLEQLVESLRICEVTPMQKPEGVFDPRLHKVLGTEVVEPDQDGVIQRVVRSGWYLNGRVFRQAEVVVGKTRQNNDTQVWTEGKQ